MVYVCQSVGNPVLSLPIPGILVEHGLKYCRRITFFEKAGQAFNNRVISGYGSGYFERFLCAGTIENRKGGVMIPAFSVFVVFFLDVVD
jgi:hypothetical protein